MYHFIIKKNDANQRLDKFLKKAAPNLPTSLLYKAIRTKNIKLNGKRTYANTILSLDDKIDCYLPGEFFIKKTKLDFLQVPAEIDIIYEDENIILVNKPAGLLSQPESSALDDCIISRIKHYLYKTKAFVPSKELSFTPSLVNRLDRNTGGIVIAAKNAEVLRLLNQKIKNHEIRRFYLTLVEGTFKERQGTYTGFSLKNKEKNIITIVNEPQQNAKKVETKYHILESKNNISLIEAELITGRSHQIRAQFSHAGHPLVGDIKYGAKTNNQFHLQHQALYAYRILFDFSDESFLSYLNQKTFQNTEIPFYHKFKRW